MSTPLRPKEKDVLHAVAKAGALTSRRVVEAYGPRPNWYGLLTDDLLTESGTLYGKVLHLTDRGHKLLAQPDLPKLTSPSTAVDRAYQNDALRQLLADGYTVDKYEYQGAGGQQRAALLAQGRPPYTSAITSITLQVPRKVANQIYVDTRYQVAPYIHRHDSQAQSEQRGHPRLYASIRGGGITLPALRKLYKRHYLDTSIWHHPLLLAVPDPRPLQMYLRALEVRRKESGEQWAIGYPLVRLIHLPLVCAG